MLNQYRKKKGYERSNTSDDLLTSFFTPIIHTLIIQLKKRGNKLTISVLKDNSLSNADKCEKNRSFSNILET